MNRIGLYGLVAFMLVCGSTSCTSGTHDTDEASAGAEPLEFKVSRIGEYRGYGEPVYDGFERKSVYVPNREGIRLAVDIYLPTRQGVKPAKPLPAILRLTPYNRAERHLKTGELRYDWEAGSPSRQLLAHGYALVTADARGFGASFGTRDDFLPDATDGRDGYDLIEWIAKQPWSNGRVGMRGTSWKGRVQLFVAAERPPHLAAIFAQVLGSPDALDNLFFAKGGISWKYLFVSSSFKASVESKKANSSIEWSAPPVDADPDGRLLAEARRQRQFHADPDQRLRQHDAESGFFRDSGSWDPNWRSGLLSGLRAAKIPTYIQASFFDYASSDSWFAQLSGPRKLVIGPGTHDEYGLLGKDDPRNIVDSGIRIIEPLRWFDYWLKGIENGVMNEPSVHYTVMDVEQISWAWRSAPAWPDPAAKQRQFYFAPERAGTIDSINDGSLVARTGSPHTQSWMQ
ncbi:MAG: CocE/NonD family hydrolase, partial [Tepidisphaeraceae bacterium]